MDFALRIVKKPKQHGDYYRPGRGECVIEEDGRDYGYRVKRGERREFRLWAENAFGRKITGAWPSYRAGDRW